MNEPVEKRDLNTELAELRAEAGKAAQREHLLLEENNTRRKQLEQGSHTALLARGVQTLERIASQLENWDDKGRLDIVGSMIVEIEK